MNINERIQLREEWLKERIIGAEGPISFIRVTHSSNVELCSFSTIVSKDIDSIRLIESRSEEIIDFRDFSHSSR